MMFLLKYLMEVVQSCNGDHVTKIPMLFTNIVNIYLYIVINTQILYLLLFTCYQYECDGFYADN